MSLKNRKPIVAIDGPAGAGKSTVARRLAERFELLNLESGAMYRAFALKALRLGIALDALEPLMTLAAETEIRLEPNADGNRVLLDGEDVTGLVRNATVTDAASKVSVLPSVRLWMVRQQQQMGVAGGVIMEGRDIGTVVFPQAEVKIFLDADVEERGKRRVAQLGNLSAERAAAIVEELKERDLRDRTRAESPLKAAADAIVLDSTHLNFDQVVERAEQIVVARLAELSAQS